MKTIILICAILMATYTFLLSSCEQAIHAEIYEERITSILLTLTPDSGQMVILSFIDNDGPGGMVPLVNSCELRESTSYVCQISLGSRNANASAKLEHFIDSTSVAGTPEVHQVFFSRCSDLFMNSEYADVDLNGFPIGFSSTLTTGRASAGSLSVRIVHHPNKSAPNVSLGNPSQAGGCTDVEAVFQVKVK